VPRADPPATILYMPRKYTWRIRPLPIHSGGRRNRSGLVSLEEATVNSHAARARGTVAENDHLFPLMFVAPPGASERRFNRPRQGSNSMTTTNTFAATHSTGPPIQRADLRLAHRGYSQTPRWGYQRRRPAARIAGCRCVHAALVHGGSGGPPRKLPAAGAFTRHSCAAGRETRRANCVGGGLHPPFHARKTALVGAEHPPYMLVNRPARPATHNRGVLQLF